MRQSKTSETYQQIGKSLQLNQNSSEDLFGKLPKVLLLLILSYLADPAELALVALVSRQFRNAVDDDVLWKKFWRQLTKKEEKTLHPTESYKVNYVIGSFRKEWHSYAKRNAKFLKTPQITNEWRIIPSKKNKFLDLCETGNKQSLINFLKGLKPTDLVTKTFDEDESDIEQINQALVLALNNKNNGGELFKIVVDFFEAGDNPDDRFYLVKFLKEKNRWILYQKYKDRLQVTHKKMFEAVKNADIDLVEFLLSISPNNCLATVYGHTAILNYAFNEAIWAIKESDRRAPRDGDSFNDHNAIENKVAVAKLLLSRAKIVFARDGLPVANFLSMDKLLHDSVEILHFEFFKLLIDSGTELTALWHKNNLWHCLAELPPQLIEGKYENFCKISELISQKQLNVEAVNGKNETPAFIAVIKKNTRVLEKLIELGATLDTVFLKATYAEKETSYEVKYLLLLLENRSLKLENRLLKTELETIEEASITQSNVGSVDLKFN